MEAIHHTIQGLRTKYNGEFDASKLFKHLDQAPPAEAHWNFTSPAVINLITLAVFPIGAIIWKKYLRNLSITTTDADAHYQPQINQQGCKIEHLNINLDQYFIKEEPCRRGEISEMIFEK